MPARRKPLATHGRTIHWVKLGSGGGCQSGLFYPQQQTFAARANTSVWCHNRTRAPQQPYLLFDHLVGTGEKDRSDFDPKRFCSFEIDHHLEFCRLLDRKFARFFTRKDSNDVFRRGTILILDIGSVAYQTASLCIIAPLVDGGQPMFGRAIDNQAPLDRRKVRAAAHHSALCPFSECLAHGDADRFRLRHIDEAIFDTERLCGLVLAWREQGPDRACRKDGNPGKRRDHFLEYPEDLARDIPFHAGKSGDVSARTRQVLDEAAYEWIRG